MFYIFNSYANNVNICKNFDYKLEDSFFEKVLFDSYMSNQILQREKLEEFSKSDYITWITLANLDSINNIFLPRNRFDYDYNFDLCVDIIIIDKLSGDRDVLSIPLGDQIKLDNSKVVLQALSCSFSQHHAIHKNYYAILLEIEEESTLVKENNHNEILKDNQKGWAYTSDLSYLSDFINNHYYVIQPLGCYFVVSKN